MINPDVIVQLGKQIADSLPPGAIAAQQDIEKNLRALIQSAFSKLDLVSRDEFDAQVAVLQRTRERIEALEKEVAALESALK